MSEARATVLEWVANGALPRERASQAFRIACASPGVPEWRRFLETLFLWLGAACVAAALVFFVAANWQGLSRFTKFGAVELALVASVAFALWRGLDTLPGKAAMVTAALLCGALLALVGQVYQTGADTFELFAAWAAGIFMWVVVARQPPLWVIWVGILNLALVFYFQAVPGRPFALFGPRGEWLALFALNSVALAAAEFATVRRFAGFSARWASRVLALASGVAVTFLAVWGVLEFRDGAAIHLALYMLWAGAIYWAYRMRTVDLFILSGAVLSLVVVAAVALARALLDHGGAGAFLLMGLIVVAGAGAGAWWLRRVAAEEGAQ